MYVRLGVGGWTLDVGGRGGGKERRDQRGRKQAGAAQLRTDPYSLQLIYDKFFFFLVGIN